MRLAGPRNFLPTRPFLCELFSLLFSHKSGTRKDVDWWVAGMAGMAAKMAMAVALPLGAYPFWPYGFASAPFFWLSAFVRQLAIVWATEIAHSWTSAGGGGAPFGIRLNSKILCIWKI